jgi:hypothetical protein
MRKESFYRLTGGVWRTFCSELTAVVWFCYFLCVTVVLIAAGMMVGLVNISTPEKVSHYSHPRPEVERNDRESRLFMVVPKTKHGSPPKNIEATHKRGAVKRATNGGY